MEIVDTGAEERAEKALTDANTCNGAVEGSKRGAINTGVLVGEIGEI